MKDIAIVILNWNGAAMLHKFLPSVIKGSTASAGSATDSGVDVVVADNGSTDNSLELVAKEFPSVRCIQLDKNYGFAEGYNKALEQVEARYYVLLNSDVAVPEGWLLPLQTYMDAHADVAACQPKILCEYAPHQFEYAGAAGGYLDYLGYPFCRGRLFATVESDKGQYNTTTDIFWATGAALFIRAEKYWEVGGLDGRFFAHQEEIDLCWRLRARGNRIVCLPASQVFHVGGGTLPKENPRKTFLNFRNNMLLLYKNLPASAYHKVMFLRFWLDALASFAFLAKGEWGSFKAVWQGRKAFCKMRKDFQKDREFNLSLTTLSSIPEMMRTSLLVDYYLKGKKTFQQLSYI